MLEEHGLLKQTNFKALMMLMAVSGVLGLASSRDQKRKIQNMDSNSQENSKENPTAKSE